MLSQSFILLALFATSFAAPPDSVTISSRAPCKQVFKTKVKETCYSLDEKFKLVSGSIYTHNTFLKCADVWVGTDICVPNGPFLADVCTSTYRSKRGDTCASLDVKHDLVDGTIKSVNGYLDCKTGIWENSPICVPSGPRRSPPPNLPPNANCKETYRSVAGETCTSLETKFGLATGAIKAFNDFLTCENIWKDTSICVPKGLTKTECRSVHVSKKDDTCVTIESTFTLTAGALKTANPFIDCANIWAWTPLCIPIATNTPVPNPNPNPGTTPQPETCTGNEMPVTAHVSLTCAAIDEMLGLFPGAVQAHLPNLACASVPIKVQMCVPTGPIMRVVCHSVHAATVGQTCASIDADYSLAEGSIATANPLLECTGNRAILESTRVCIPEPPSPPPNPTPQPVTCGEDEQPYTTSADIKTCAIIEHILDLFPGAMKAHSPSLNCDNLPTDVKICAPKGPNMHVVCGAVHSTWPDQTCSSVNFAYSVAYTLAEGAVAAANPLLQECTSNAILPTSTRVCIPKRPAPPP